MIQGETGYARLQNHALVQLQQENGIFSQTKTVSLIVGEPMHRLLVTLLFIISLAHAESSRESDSLVLLSIKEKNPVVQGSTISSWKPDRPMVQWYGVYFDETSGRVRRIEFKNCSLSVIPAEIQSLDSLDYLDIRRNKLDMRTMEPELVKYVNKVSADPDWATLQIIDYGGSRETDSLVLLELARLNPWLEWDTSKTLREWGINGYFGGIQQDRIIRLNISSVGVYEKYGERVELKIPNTFHLLSMLTDFRTRGGLFPIWIGTIDSTFIPPYGIALNAVPEKFWTLPFLKNVEFVCTLVDSSLANITDAKYLNSLNLGYTELDTLPASIGELKCLDTLQIEFCHTKSIPDAITALKPKYLNVSYNHLFKENLSTETVNWLNTYAPNWESDQFRPTVSVVPHTANPKRSLTISSSNAQLTFSERLPHGTTLRIHDLKGRVLFQGLVSGTTMALPTLSTGNYLVSIANRHINTTAKVQITGSSVR